MLLATALFAGLLVLFDVYISHRRIKQYGRFAELNLLVRQAIADFGLIAGLSLGLAYNVALLAMLVYLKLGWLLTFFAGVKFGLVLMQLKSMQMESFVERILAQARARKQSTR